MKKTKLISVFLVVFMLIGTLCELSILNVRASSSNVDVFDTFGDYVSNGENIRTGWRTSRGISADLMRFKSEDMGDEYGRTYLVSSGSQDFSDMFYKFETPYETGAGSGYLTISCDVMLPCSETTDVSDYEFSAGFLPSDEWLQLRYGDNYDGSKKGLTLSTSDPDRRLGGYVGFLAYYKTIVFQGGNYGHYTSTTTELNLSNTATNSTFHEGGTAEKNKWYTIDTIIDLNTRKATSYLNGAKYIDNVEFGIGAGDGYGSFPIDGFGFEMRRKGTGEYSGMQYYVDNFCVIHSDNDPMTSGAISAIAEKGDNFVLEGKKINIAFSEYIGEGNIIADDIIIKNVTNESDVTITDVEASGKSAQISILNVENDSSYAISLGELVFGSITTRNVGNTLSFQTASVFLDTFGDYVSSGDEIRAGWRTSRGIGGTSQNFTSINSESRGTAIKVNQNANLVDMYYQFDKTYSTGSGSGYLAVSYDLMLPFSTTADVTKCNFGAGFLPPDEWMHARYGTAYDKNIHKGFSLHPDVPETRIGMYVGYFAFYKTYMVAKGVPSYHTSSNLELNFSNNSSGSTLHEIGPLQKGTWHTVDTVIDLNTRKVTAYFDGVKYCEDIPFGHPGTDTYASTPIEAFGFEMKSFGTSDYSGMIFYIDNFYYKHSQDNPLTSGGVYMVAEKGSKISVADNSVVVAFTEWIDPDTVITSDFSIKNKKTDEELTITDVSFSGKSAEVFFSDTLDYESTYELSINNLIAGAVTGEEISNMLVLSTESGFEIEEFTLTKSGLPVDIGTLSEGDEIKMYIKINKAVSTPIDIMLGIAQYSQDIGVYRMDEFSSKIWELTAEDVGVLDEELVFTIGNQSDIDMLSGFVWNAQSLQPYKKAIKIVK